MMRIEKIAGSRGVARTIRKVKSLMKKSPSKARYGKEGFGLTAPVSTKRIAGTRSPEAASRSMRDFQSRIGKATKQDIPKGLKTTPGMLSKMREYVATGARS
jgi:hypothetical protein